MTIYHLIAIVVLIIVLKFIVSTPAFKGCFLEFQIDQKLKKLSVKLDGYHLRDIMLMEGERTSQIDNLFMTDKALYVIEAKNYKGFIYGSEYQDQWTLTQRKTKSYRSKKGKRYSRTYINKYTFYNPIKQNQTHIRFIEKNIAHSVPLINTIVFGNRALLKKIDGVSNAIVLNLKDLIRSINSIEAQKIPSLSKPELEGNVWTLSKNNVLDKKMRKNHIRMITDFSKNVKD